MNYYLYIIQGDTFTSHITIKQNGSVVSSSLISGVYFTSHQLNIQKTLTYDSTIQKYKLELLASETDILKDGEFNYDITIKFTDNTIKTALYEKGLIVLKKSNEVDYE